jgi:hypothetical protein
LRKKLISITLAIMLICEYTANALSADAYSAANKFRDDILNKNFGSDAPTNVLSIDEMDKNSLIGKITSVMHYKMGQLVALQEQNGSISIYDASGFRATLSKTKDGKGEAFEISNLSLRSTDLNWVTIEEKGAVQCLVDLLVGVGFEKWAANAFAENIGEDVIKALKENGINSSFGISSDGQGNLRCTLNLDGKPQKTVDTYGDLVAEWIYNSNTGALEQSIVYSWSPPVSGEKDSKGKFVATVTYYDPNGKEVGTHQCDVIDGTGGTSGSRFPRPYNLDYENQVLTTTYQYDKNGSKISEFNVKENDYTYYGVGGKPTEVVNVNKDTGHRTVKSKYTYYLSGILKTLTKNNANGEPEYVSVFSSRGEFWGSGITKDPEELFKRLEDVYQKFKNLNSTNQNNFLQYLYNNKITEFSFTPNDIEQNPYIFITLFLNEKEQEEILAIWSEMKKSNKDATFKDALRKKIKDADEAAKLQGNDKDTSSVIDAYRTLLELLNVISRSKGSFKVKVESGQFNRSKEIEKEQKYEFNESTGSWNAVVKTRSSVEQFIDTNVKFSIEFTNYSTLPPTVSTLSNERTGDSKKTGETSKEDEKYLSYSVAVVGEAKAFVDVSGNVLTEDEARKMIAGGNQIYIQLNPKSVNMFDGSQFKDIVNPKEGEQIYVAVEDMDMFNAFKGAVGTDTKVAVAGLVTNDMAGKMTMQVYNKDSGRNVGFNLNSTNNKGYAVGNKVSDDMVKEINRAGSYSNSWVYKSIKANRGIFQAAGASDKDNSLLNDWKAGWAALVKLLNGKN